MRLDITDENGWVSNCTHNVRLEGLAVEYGLELL